MAKWTKIKTALATKSQQPARSKWRSIAALAAGPIIMASGVAALATNSAINSARHQTIIQAENIPSGMQGMPLSDPDAYQSVGMREAAPTQVAMLPPQAPMVNAIAALPSPSGPRYGGWLTPDRSGELGFNMGPPDPSPVMPDPMRETMQLQNMDPTMRMLVPIVRATNGDPVVMGMLARQFGPILQATHRGSNPNLYAYVNNNPISFTDPTGLSAQPGGGTSCPANNDLYNKCVENCIRENAGDPQAIANCIWFVCRRYLGQ